MFFLFSFKRRLKQSPLPPSAKKHYFLNTPPHAHPKFPLTQTFFLGESLVLSSPRQAWWLLGCRWQSAANCRHRMGFGGTLCTWLPFPSDRTKGKFDFVLSKGSQNLCSLLHANDMRWDPLQLLLKCIRGRSSAERPPFPLPGWKLNSKVPGWNFQVRGAGLDQIT